MTTPRPCPVCARVVTDVHAHHLRMAVEVRTQDAADRCLRRRLALPATWPPSVGRPHPRLEALDA